MPAGWTLHNDDTNLFVGALYNCLSDFNCSLCFEGQQYVGSGADFYGTPPYILNLVYSTVEEQLSTFLVPRPQFILSPRPGAADYDFATAIGKTAEKQAETGLS